MSKHDAIKGAENPYLKPQTGHHLIFDKIHKFLKTFWAFWPFIISNLDFFMKSQDIPNLIFNVFSGFSPPGFNKQLVIGFGKCL